MDDRRREPVSSRPDFPAAYGLPADRSGLLSWEHAVVRLEGARNYWIGTTGADGAPHVVPVWGVWTAGRLLFGTDPTTRTARNLARNPAAAIHLESGDDVVIIEGVVELVDDPAIVRHSAILGAAKYGTPAPSDDAAGATGPVQPVFALVPRTAYAWSEFPTNATRWRFENREGHR